MGILRILLALAVVLGHTGPIFGFNHLDGVIAVQSFFIISGFYMSLIINEKYNAKNSYKLFISNRLLRLFPTYFCITLLTFIVIYILEKTGTKQEIFANFLKVDFFSKIYICIINISIVGQDSTLFLGFNSTGSLHYISNFWNSSPLVFTLLLCPQAWSLSLELMFYFLAPLLVKKNVYLILIFMFFSFVLRILIYKHGYFFDPWTYRFFPTEIFFFLSGNISYRLYTFLKKSKHSQKFGLSVFIIIILLILLFNFIPIQYYLKQYLFYLIFTFAIPLIFIYTKKNSIDRFIGELSYPIYLSHWFIIVYCIPLLNHAHYSPSINGLLGVILTIIFSILLILILIKPIDNYREKRTQLYNIKLLSRL